MFPALCGANAAPPLPQSLIRADCLLNNWIFPDTMKIFSVKNRKMMRATNIPLENWKISVLCRLIVDQLSEQKLLLSEPGIFLCI